MAGKCAFWENYTPLFVSSSHLRLAAKPRRGGKNNVPSRLWLLDAIAWGRAAARRSPPGKHAPARPRPRRMCAPSMGWLSQAPRAAPR